MKKIYVILLVTFVSLCIVGGGIFLLLNKSKSNNDESINMKVFNDGLVLVKEGNQYSYLDKSGNVVIEDNFVYGSNFLNGRAIVAKIMDNERQYTLINNKGKNVLDGQYYDGLSYNMDVSVYTYYKNGKAGLMDSKGKLITEPLYRQISYFYEGLARVSNDTKFGFIDKNGRLIGEMKYNKAIQFINGMAIVSDDFKVGAINTKGEMVVPYQHLEIMPFNEFGYACTIERTSMFEETYKIIDKNNNVVYNAGDNRLLVVGNYFYLIYSSIGKAYIINEKGEKMLDQDINIINYNRNYYKFVYTKENEDYLGFYDSTLKFISEIKYSDEAGYAIDMKENELSIASKVDGGIKIDNGSTSFIFECDPEGMHIDQYSNNGYYVIRNNYGFKGVIDSQGKVVIDIIHKQVILSTDGYAIVEDEKAGVFNMKNEIIITQKYDDIIVLKNILNEQPIY